MTKRKKTEPKPYVFETLQLIEPPTIDDVVEALRAAPWEVRDEVRRKLDRRLTATDPAEPGAENDKPTSDVVERCKTIARLDDESLRKFMEIAESTAAQDRGHFAAYLIGQLAEEVLRMRRDLRAAGVTP